MFPEQQNLLKILPEIQQLLNKHRRPQDWLNAFEYNTRHFVVRVPLVGAFSSGKSSMLNALMGEHLFATSVDPQTAVPAELSYGPEESFTGCQSDGKRIPLQRDDIRCNRLESLQPDGWVDVRLPAASLASLPHLRLVDMPGWDSSNNRHAQAIDGYVSRSLAYCIVVSADEGSLHESIRAALKELKLHGMPIIAIINKCDKKIPEQITAIAGQISAEIEKTLGKPPMRVVEISARKNELDGLIAALAELENQAEPLFVQAVVKPFAEELSLFAQYLDTLINRDDLNSEQIALERERIAKEMHDFDTRLSEETHQLDARIPKVLATIFRNVEDRLTAQLDSLTSQVLSGRDLRGTIDQTIRLVVTEGIQEEFEPEMQHYFGKIADALPNDIQLDLRLPEGRQIQTDSDSGIGSDTIKGVLSTIILLKFPQAKALIPLLNGVIDLLSNMFTSKANREIAEAERRENVRQHLLVSVIPQAVQTTKSAMLPMLQAHVQLAKTSISHSVQKQRDALGAAFTELNTQLLQGQAAFAAARQHYEADQQTVQTILDRLEHA